MSRANGCDVSRLQLKQLRRIAKFEKCANFQFKQRSVAVDYLFDMYIPRVLQRLTRISFVSQ